MNSRRRQLLVAAGSLLASSLAHAQPVPKLRRVGFLLLQPMTASLEQIFRGYLRRAGYEEGRNLLVEWRSADADPGRLPAMADDLARLKVEVILTGGREADEAAKRATSTIPIVMMGTLFPVERGLINSLARPGGNVTGTVWFADPLDVSSKKYQIFRDAVPNASRILSILYEADPIYRFWDKALEQRRAEAMGFSMQAFPMLRRDELRSILDRVASNRPDVLSVGGNLGLMGVFEEIAAFALQQKLVSYSDNFRYTDLGGLLSYGPNFEGLFDLTFSYVDKILRGAKPADLPVQQATKWDLTLNAKTAQAIGFKPPPAFMLQVTRQIE